MIYHLTESQTSRLLAALEPAGIREAVLHAQLARLTTTSLPLLAPAEAADPKALAAASTWLAAIPTPLDPATTAAPVQVRGSPIESHRIPNESHLKPPRHFHTPLDPATTRAAPV